MCGPSRFSHSHAFILGAMYPNIILTNRLQPPAIVTPAACANWCAESPMSLPHKRSHPSLAQHAQSTGVQLQKAVAMDVAWRGVLCKRGVASCAAVDLPLRCDFRAFRYFLPVSASQQMSELRCCSFLPPTTQSVPCLASVHSSSLRLCSIQAAARHARSSR